MVKKVKNESEEFENENVLENAEEETTTAAREVEAEDDANEDDLNLYEGKEQQEVFDWDKYEAEKGGYSEEERNSLQNK